MSATRYCRQVKIVCKLVPARDMPHGEQYKCNLSVGGKRLGTQYVGIPAHIDKAIDSPKAYDDAAHAALSFAVDEEERGERDWGGLADKLEYDDAGFSIRRQKGYRHNVGPRGGGLNR